MNWKKKFCRINNEVVPNIRKPFIPNTSLNRPIQKKCISLKEKYIGTNFEYQ